MRIHKRCTFTFYSSPSVASKFEYLASMTHRHKWMSPRLEGPAHTGRAAFMLRITPPSCAIGPGGEHEGPLARPGAAHTSTAEFPDTGPPWARRRRLGAQIGVQMSSWARYRPLGRSAGRLRRLRRRRNPNRRPRCRQRCAREVSVRRGGPLRDGLGSSSAPAPGALGGDQWRAGLGASCRRGRERGDENGWRK